MAVKRTKDSGRKDRIGRTIKISEHSEESAELRKDTLKRLLDDPDLVIDGQRKGFGARDFGEGTADMFDDSEVTGWGTVDEDCLVQNSTITAPGKGKSRLADGGATLFLGNETKVTDSTVKSPGYVRLDNATVDDSTVKANKISVRRGGVVASTMDLVAVDGDGFFIDNSTITQKGAGPTAGAGGTNLDGANISCSTITAEQADIGRLHGRVEESSLHVKQGHLTLGGEDGHMAYVESSTVNCGIADIGGEITASEVHSGRLIVDNKGGVSESEIHNADSVRVGDHCHISGVKADRTGTISVTRPEGALGRSSIQDTDITGCGQVSVVGASRIKDADIRGAGGSRGTGVTVSGNTCVTGAIWAPENTEVYVHVPHVKGAGEFHVDADTTPVVGMTRNEKTGRSHPVLLLGDDGADHFLTGVRGDGTPYFSVVKDHDDVRRLRSGAPTLNTVGWEDQLA